MLGLGGSIGTPQLLMLSGIGPAAVLAQHGIAQVHELPGVGFFVVPADNRTNTERIFVYRHSVRSVATE